MEHFVKCVSPVLLIALSILALSIQTRAQTPNLQAVCEVAVPATKIREIERTLEPLRGSCAESGGQLIACADGATLYAVCNNADLLKRWAAYRKNSIVSPERLMRKELTALQRADYVRELTHRARLVVHLALESQKIKDAQIVRVLQQIRIRLDGPSPVSPEPPSRIGYCARSYAPLKGMEAASAWGVTLAGTIYMCSGSYADEGPLRLIHELVHSVRNAKRYDPNQDECLCDLVAMTAVRAAHKYKPDRVPEDWSTDTGPYMDLCPSKFQNRLVDF